MTIHYRDLLSEYWRQMTIDGQNVGRLGKIRLWKYFPQWVRSNTKTLDPLGEALPWMIYPAIERLRDLVGKGDRIFEFGSGGSTLFFLRHGARLTTVEHDRGWFDRVSVSARALAPDWTGVLEEPQKTEDLAIEASELTSYRSSDEAYLGHTFKSYAQSIAPFPNEHFDLISIDGRARPSCYFEALPKLKRGGFIVLDNSEREVYAQIELDARKRSYGIEKMWGPGPYNRYFWQTVFIHKTGSA